MGVNHEVIWAWSARFDVQRYASERCRTRSIVISSVVTLKTTRSRRLSLHNTRGANHSHAANEINHIMQCDAVHVRTSYHKFPPPRPSTSSVEGADSECRQPHPTRG